MLTALDSLDAIFAIQPWRRIKPNESHLRDSGHLNLETSLGHLDLLTNIGNNLRYDDLLKLSTPMLVDEGVRINVLGLRTLIELKEQLRGEKDLAMLPILRQTLRESQN